MLLAAFVLLGVVAVGWCQVCPPAVVLAVTGAASTVWVTLCDLGVGLPWPPGALTLTGNLMLLVGLLTLMGLSVPAGQLPVWAPLALPEVSAGRRR